MNSQIARRARSHPHHVAGALLILGVLALNIYRAINQSITHDEALTFNAFVSEGWRVLLFTFDSNNHVLHSVLMRISTSLFGISALSLRLPALLGGLLYMLVMERISREFFRDKLTYLLALAAAILSPFILDYLVLARGYSLALAFLMAALLLGGREMISAKHSNGISLIRLTLISSLCAFSVAANLAFAFPATALLITVFIFSLRQSSGHAWIVKLASLALPGALLFCALNPAIFNFTSSQMYFGADSWSETARSLTAATFDGSASAASKTVIAPILRAIPWLALLVISLAGVSLLIKPSKGIAVPQSRLWLFLSAILAATLALQTLANLLFDALLPFERTGIYFLPLVITLLALSIELSIRGKNLHWLGWGGQLLLLLSAMIFIANLRTDHFRGREYDAHAKEIYESLRAMDIHRNSEIGINWLLEPSLNFYRSFFGDSYMPIFTRDGPNAADHFFVLLPQNSAEDTRLISDLDIQIVYEEDFSQAIIGLRK